VKAVALAALSLAPAGPAPPPDPEGFRLTAARVTPARAFFAGRRVRIRFRFSADGPLDVRVEVVRRATGRVAQRFLLRGARPGALHRLRWHGVTGRGRAAPDGRYRVRIGPVGGRLSRGGSFMMRGHYYPVRGPHWSRGWRGLFGAPRSGGRRHEGFDVVARCGTPVVAARGGRVKRNLYDPKLYGNLVIIRGSKSRRDYWYSHLSRRSRLRRGANVHTGQLVGRVGATGNARTVGCHLHFEIRSRGRPIDPRPHLRRWDRWS
jgi:murein DD-endopeptidase MepM/ murein hydrolase activator NlpD